MIFEATLSDLLEFTQEDSQAGGNQTFVMYFFSGAKVTSLGTIVTEIQQQR